MCILTDFSLIHSFVRTSCRVSLALPSWVVRARTPRILTLCPRPALPLFLVSAGGIGQILSIRASAESLEVDQVSLAALGKIGARTSLR